MMTDEPIPQPAPASPIPNGNNWKRKALGKLAENPVGFLDWAFKVGVSSAIGLYLVVSLTGAMKSYLAIQGEETIKQTRQITEMALATKEVSLSQGTIKDMSKAGQEAARAAQDAAGIAARGMADQKPIFESIEKSSTERTKLQREILAETKQIVPSFQKMESAAAADRKSYWFAAEKRDDTMLQNQRIIIERLIPLPAKPEPPKK